MRRYTRWIMYLGLIHFRFVQASRCSIAGQHDVDVIDMVSMSQ